MWESLKKPSGEGLPECRVAARRSGRTLLEGKWAVGGKGLLPSPPPPSMGTPAGEVPGAKARENPSLSLYFLSVLVFLVFS